MKDWWTRQLRKARLLIDRKRRRRLLHAIETLPSPADLVFHYLCRDLPFDVIAATLGMTVGDVEIHLVTAIRHIDDVMSSP
jgi:DNA-directed RNA polymerase specialized sigma24 family protein